MLKKCLFSTTIFLTTVAAHAEVYLGNLNTNQYDPNSVSNPYGQYGNQFSQYSIHNKFGRYGSPFSDYSAANQFATHPPKLYDQNETYLGKLSINTFDPESVSNPYGTYGNKCSLNSAWNQYYPWVISIYGE